MTVAEDVAVIQAQAELLGPRLFEGTASAVQEAEGRNGGFERGKYPHLRPMTVRVCLREYLESEGLPGGWRVGGDPRLMGQLLLQHEELGLELRVLKERSRTYPGGVPTAGRNRARRDAWQGELFPLSECASRQRVGFGELLLLWDYADPNVVAEGFTLRIVHPVEPGVYGRAVRVDVNLAVRSGGTIFTSRAFVGDDEDQDFFESDESDGSVRHDD